MDRDKEGQYGLFRVEKVGMGKRVEEEEEEDETEAGG